MTIDDLIACPTCDAVYRARPPEPGGKATCGRCHRVLIAPRRDAAIKVIALSIAISVLVVAAVFHPFLTISAGGFVSETSLIGIARSFGPGPLALVSVLTIWVLVLVPLVRTALLLYVLVPIVRGWQTGRHAGRALRLSEELKPWAMTEIFAIGCAVALVKVADLAQLDFGPAFWMFCLLVGIVLVNDRYMCTWSIWKQLETDRS